MENREYWQGVSSRSFAQRFGKHASQTQDCIVEQRAEEKRQIAEFVRVHGVVAIQLVKGLTPLTREEGGVVSAGQSHKKEMEGGRGMGPGHLVPIVTPHEGPSAGLARPV